MVQGRFWRSSFLADFGPIFRRKTVFFKAIWDFPWAKMRHHGLKMGQKHLFEHPEWSKSTFGSVFDPFLVPKRPLFKACWDFPRAKTRTHGYKMGKKHLSEPLE